MKGSRAISNEEIAKILDVIKLNKYPSRDRALFILGLRTGFRISELLSLKIKDVLQSGSFVNQISVARDHMKKKIEGRTVILHPEAKEALEDWVRELIVTGHSSSDTFVFRSQQGPNRSLGRRGALKMLATAYQKCGLTGKLGTHCMRKTFAKKVYDKSGHDLMKTQKALNHKSISSTTSYLSFAEEDIDDLILKS